MKCSVCVASRRARALPAAIASIQRQTWPDWELLVVGQGADTTVRQVTEACARTDPRVRYLHVAHAGASRARNVAMQAATGEILAVIDDDCEAQGDWLAVLVGCFAEDPTLGLVGGAVIALPPSRPGLSACPAIMPMEARYDPLASARQAPAGWDWIGANCALRRSLLSRVGLFDEYLGPGTSFGAGEDTDYKLRLEAAGIPMRTTPRAVVHHTGGRRYGLRAVSHLSRSYAHGNAALAAKLTLLGDPRGQLWLETARADVRRAWRQPRRLPAHAARLWHFWRAYRQCLRHYRVDPATCLLVPIAAASPLVLSS